MPGQVVVTGLGIVSPIGIGVSEFWKAALAGHSGVSMITSFEPFPMEGYRSKVAGQVHGFFPRTVPRQRPSRTSGPVRTVCAGRREGSPGGLRPSDGRRGSPPGRRHCGRRHGRHGHGRTGDHPTLPTPASSPRPSQLYSGHHAELGLGHRGHGAWSQGAQLHRVNRLLIERPRVGAGHAVHQGRPCRRRHHRRRRCQHHAAGLRGFLLPSSPLHQVQRSTRTSLASL